MDLKPNTKRFGAAHEILGPANADSLMSFSKYKMQNKRKKKILQ